MAATAHHAEPHGTPVNASPQLELCFGTVRDATLPQLINAAAAGGFSAVSVSPRLLDQANEAGWTTPALRLLMADSGVRVTYVDGYSKVFPDAVAAPRSMVGTVTEGDFVRVAEALGATGVNVIHLAGPPTTPETELADHLGRFCERASAHDLDVFLEFLPGTGVPDLSTALRVVTAAGDNAKITFDTVLHHRGGGTAVLDDAAVARIGVIQVCDWNSADPDPDDMRLLTDRRLPGQGDLALVDTMRRLWAARPDLPIGVEVFSTAMRALDPSDAAKLAGDAMRSVLAAAGIETGLHLETPASDDTDNDDTENGAAS